MDYPHSVPHVAACATLTATSRDVATRGALRAHGAEFEDELRAAIGEAADRAPHYPEPKTLVRDVARGRPASTQQLGAALVAIAASTITDADWQRLWVRLASWGGSLRSSAGVCLEETFIAECRHQAEADPQQAMMLIALQRGDRAGMERAIASTEQHVAAQQLLLAAAKQQLRMMRPKPTHRITVRSALVASSAR